MYITNMKLNNFRNYDKLNIGFSKNFNIIYGDNAQGKTNILEAIYICASGRSHRTSKDAEIVRIGQEGYYISLMLEKLSGESSIEIFYERDGKKKIKINEIPVPKMGNLMGQLNAVMFSPEDLLIIKEGPSERRRFIDITLSQLRPTYFYDLQQYNKVLSQRNTLLKNIQDNRSLIDTLGVWNSNLVTIGSRIIKIRNEFIKKLSKSSEESHKRLTNGSEKLLIKYVPSVGADALGNIDDVENIAEFFGKTLERSYSREILKGSTLYGPQRDDYEFYINDMELKTYGSQGQQRTAVLALKFAEIEIMKQDTGEFPILLLDDVMSELDQKRQEFLLSSLENVQTFITCTKKESFQERAVMEKSFFNIRQGMIINY